MLLLRDLQAALVRRTLARIELARASREAASAERVVDEIESEMRRIVARSRRRPTPLQRRLLELI